METGNDRSVSATGWGWKVVHFLGGMTGAGMSECTGGLRWIVVSGGYHHVGSQLSWYR